jgi:hypothetical protein
MGNIPMIDIFYITLIVVKDTVGICQQDVFPNFISQSRKRLNAVIRTVAKSVLNGSKFRGLVAISHSFFSRVKNIVLGS